MRYSQDRLRVGLVTADVDELVRQRLRALRQNRKLSLDDLAARTGVGPSTISRIETGQRSVSLDVIVPLARELGIALDELVATERDEDVVIRPQGTPWTDRLTVWSLSRPGSSIGAYKMRFEPGGEAPEPQVHPGRDWMFVIEGTVSLTLGERTILVHAGESAEFSTMTPHAVAASRGPADVVMIFDSHGEQAHLHHR